MTKFVKSILIAFYPILLVVIILLILPMNKQFAFHFIKGNCYNHGAWIYDRIFENETPVDVAFIGSSRTIHAINEREIEKKLEVNLNVVNLGYCQLGRNLQYIVLNDLLKKKTPRLVVIEITEDEQQYSHQSFGFIANSLEVVKAPIQKSYISDIFKSVIVKWEYLKARFLFNQLLFNVDTGKYGYGSSTRIVKREEINRNIKFWDDRLTKNHNSIIEKLNDSYPFHYLRKSIQLLEDKNINYCFLFIPTTHIEIEKSVFDTIYSKFAPVYYISPMKHCDLNNWMDASHFNDTGSLKVAEDISEILITELCLP